MASIGRPQLKNSFSKIKRHVNPNPKSRSAQKKALSDSLNRASGRRLEDQFVDRKTHNKLGKDGFLKLLSQQMQNQDPMKPMDQKQFAADLAQFSQLEQMTNINSNISKLGVNAPTESKFYGASFLGKEVTTKGTSIEHLGDGKISQIPFYLPDDAENLMVRVYDKHNQMVVQLDSEPMTRGNNSIAWDGRSSDGTFAVKGEYRIEVKAWDKNYEDIKPETQAKGIVTGVNFIGGETVLEVGKKQIFLRDIISFKLPEQKNNIVNDSMTATNKKTAGKAYNQMSESQL